MALVFERTFRYDHHEYRISVDFDDAAVTDNLAIVHVSAGVREAPGAPWAEVDLRVEADLEEEMVSIFIRDERIARFPLDLPLPDARDFEGADIDVEGDDAIVDDAIGDVGIERIIGMIP